MLDIYDIIKNYVAFRLTFCAFFFRANRFSTNLRLNVSKGRVRVQLLNAKLKLGARGRSYKTLLR